MDYRISFEENIDRLDRLVQSHTTAITALTEAMEMLKQSIEMLAELVMSREGGRR